DMLKTKTLSIYEQLKNSGMEFLTTFEASNSWTISGESESADKAAIESRQCHFQELLNNCHPDNILNADETGLYFCLGLNKKLASKSDTAKGYKKDKSRLTILLCYNASETQKFKPFLIDKSAYP
ncbi:24_t:CDS:2, partial [Cetraspora pellucida]